MAETGDWLTDEEHQARAMLLGLGYSCEARCYHGGNTYVDADTMEPISRREVAARIGEFFRDCFFTSDVLRG